jgi:hypothetical protein
VHTLCEHPLDTLPRDAVLCSVTAVTAVAEGRPCLRVELEDEVTRTGEPFVDYIDQATFVMLPVELTTGRIEVDVMAQLNGKTDFDARGFAGIAYRIDDQDHFEGIYVRALNGVRTDAPPPRNERGIQYFAHPDWLFDRLREQHPAEYERPADIVPSEWFSLAIDLSETDATAYINGTEALSVTHPKAPLRSGRVGLFVDIGSEAFFSNLRVEKRS